MPACQGCSGKRPLNGRLSLSRVYVRFFPQTTKYVPPPIPPVSLYRENHFGLKSSTVAELASQYVGGSTVRYGPRKMLIFVLGVVLTVLERCEEDRTVRVGEVIGVCFNTAASASAPNERLSRYSALDSFHSTRQLQDRPGTPTAVAHRGRPTANRSDNSRRPECSHNFRLCLDCSLQRL